MALAEAIRELDPEVEITFVGTGDGIEARVLPPAGHPLRFLPAAPLANRGPVGLARGLTGLASALLPARRLLRELRPHVVVGLGRHASGAPCLVAALRGLPLALLEQNAYPGLANRGLSRFASVAFLAFEECARHLPSVPCETLGTPLRRALVEAARARERRLPGPRPARVLVLGGSGGASELNRLVPPALCRLGGRGFRLEVRHQAGPGKLGEVAYDGAVAAETVEFLEDIASVYAWADVLVGRAGGGTVAEALAFGLPAVYVPLPTRDRHQLLNARVAADAGAALVVEEDAVARGGLEGPLASLLENPAALTGMSGRALTVARPDAAATLASRVLGMLRR